MPTPPRKDVSSSDLRARLLGALANVTDNTAARFLNGLRMWGDNERECRKHLAEAMRIRPDFDWKSTVAHAQDAA